MQYTSNFNLKKPDGTDSVMVQDLNNNVDIIDIELKKSADHIEDAVNHVRYGIATGTNSKNITLAPAPKSYFEGMGIAFKNMTTNTGSVTLNVNGLGAKPIVRSDGSPVPNNTLRANGIYTVRYNSSTGNFILQGEGRVADVILYDSDIEPGDVMALNTPPPAISTERMTTLTKVLTIKVGFSGNVRLKYTAEGGASNTDFTATIELRKNGNVLSREVVHTPGSSGNPHRKTFSDDINLQKNDEIEFYLKTDRDGTGSYARLYGVTFYTKPQKEVIFPTVHI